MNEFIFSLFMIFYIIPTTLNFLFKLPYSSATLFLSLLLFVVWPITQAYRRRARKQKKAQQQSFLNKYEFPRDIRLKLSARYPRLTEQGWLSIEEAMRQYFRIHIYRTGENIGMPSRVVDDYWHEFILHTRAYGDFCNAAFGRFIHHTPASKMDQKSSYQAALRRTWRGACKDENLSPQQIAILPLLFAIDANLKIPDGFIHNPALLITPDDALASLEIEGGCGSDGCSSDSDGSSSGSDSSCSSCSSGCGGD